MLTSTDASGGGVSPTNLAAVGSELYFSGEDASYIRRLWSSDGTTTGTGLVAGGTGCGDPGNLTAMSGLLYFTGCALGNYQVWQSNGTSVVEDTTNLPTGGGIVPSGLAGMSGDLYFLAPGATTWEWQPTTAVTPTITWANPASIVYGTALSSTQLDATASVNGTTIPGTFAYSPAAGTILKAGTDTLSVTFTPTDTTDYTTATGSATIVVTQATPGVAWPNPANIVYGTALSSTQLDATGSVPGTFAYSPAAGTILKAGTDTLSVTFTPTDSTDYSSVTTTATIVVTQATPVITWANPANIVSGTALSSTQLDATANTAGTFTYSPAAGTILNVGNNQALSVTFAPTDTTDYTSASDTVLINVVPASSASATFLEQDTTTQGTWIGTYGAQGYDVINAAAGLPSYATVSPAGQTPYTTVASTTNVRALQLPGGGNRVVAGWYAHQSFTVDVSLTDGQAHDLELYFLDWSKSGRVEQVQIADAATGTVLDTRTISSFAGGVYLDYNVSGDIAITITNQAGPNAVLNGLFFDS